MAGKYVTDSARTQARRMHDIDFCDTARRLTHAAGTGDYGHGAATYTSGTSFACSFQPASVRDVQGQTQVPLHDADLHYALGTVLNPADRVTITHLLHA